MTKCITGSAYGSSCDHSAPCQVTLGGSAQCLDHRCTCRASHYPRRVVNAVAKENDIDEDVSHKDRISCEPNVSFGAYCRHNGDCQMQHLELTNGPVVPVVSVAPVAMVCQWGECGCSETHQLHDNKCIPKVTMGATHHRPACFLVALLSSVCSLQLFFI